MKYSSLHQASNVSEICLVLKKSKYLQTPHDVEQVS